MPTVSNFRILIVKACLLLFGGIVIGIAMDVDLKEDAELGRALTLEQYVAGFEEHKEELKTSEMPVLLSVFAGVAMLLVLFGLYEAIAWGTAWVATQVFGERAPSKDPSDSLEDWLEP